MPPGYIRLCAPDERVPAGRDRVPVEVTDNEHQPRAPVIVGPAREHDRRMEDVVDAVDDERAGLAGNVQDAFDAQELVGMGRAEIAEPALEAVPVQRRLVHEAEAPD